MPDVRVAVLIDGGFLRVEAKKAKKIYNPDYIERFALACKAADESLFRILYYDCALYSGTVKLPVSGQPHVFESSDALKYGRRAGLQTVLIEPPKVRLAPELLSHIDFKRPVLWP